MSLLAFWLFFCCPTSKNSSSYYICGCIFSSRSRVSLLAFWLFFCCPTSKNSSSPLYLISVSRRERSTRVFHIEELVLLSLRLTLIRERGEKEFFDVGHSKNCFLLLWVLCDMLFGLMQFLECPTSKNSSSPLCLISVSRRERSNNTF